jgi:hypothetical protein
LIGTKRVVDVQDRGESTKIVGKYLDMASPEHSYIYGDFEICPLAADIPGHMRPVCLADAKRLVVQNLQRSRPPFRILATWPADERRKQNPQ